MATEINSRILKSFGFDIFSLGWHWISRQCFEGDQDSPRMTSYGGRQPNGSFEITQYLTVHARNLIWTYLSDARWVTQNQDGASYKHNELQVFKNVCNTNIFGVPDRETLIFCTLYFNNKVKKKKNKQDIFVGSCMTVAFTSKHRAFFNQ